MRLFYCSRNGSVNDSSTRNISSIASNFAVNIFKNTENGANNGNAFRHAVWQGLIVNKYGVTIAEQAGNAHEYNPFADLSVRSYTDMALADQTADLLNNQIGREIANQNPNASSQELAQFSLDYFYTNGLYNVQQAEDGTYNVTQTQLSQEEYNTGSSVVGKLNNKGKYK